MQKLFIAKGKIEDYVTGGDDLYPDAPKKCPFPDCGIHIKLKKHGYYKRYIIETCYIGEIKVRRYKCSICGRTVSMMPAFCIPRFQYGLRTIMGILMDVSLGISISQVIRNWINKMSALTRKHVRNYMQRLMRNRKSVQLVLNEISSANIALGSITEDNKWMKEFLTEMRLLKPQAFNIKFQDTTGKTFMSI